MSDFRAFMQGLRADIRLGRYVAPIVDQSPEVIVLTLAMALANAREGHNPHPAHELLERLNGGNHDARV